MNAFCPDCGSNLADVPAHEQELMPCDQRVCSEACKGDHVYNCTACISLYRISLEDDLCTDCGCTYDPIYMFCPECGGT